MCSQSIAGTDLSNNAAAAVRTVCVELLIGWGLSAWPSDWAAEATDETDRLLSCNWSRRLSYEPLRPGTGEVARLTLVLDNRDQRYSPFNTGGALYSDLLDSTTTTGGSTVEYPKLWQIPVRLRMGFNDADNGDEFITVFSGIIDGEASELYGVQGDRLTLTVLDRGAVLLRLKDSTELKTNWRVDEWIRFLCATVGGIEGGSYDHGFAVVPYAWLDDENVYKDAQMAAASEGGHFFFDETGLPQYKNVLWWLTDSDCTSSQWTFTTARFVDFSPTYSWDTVGTGVVVEYEGRYPAGQQSLYRSDETITVLSNDTTEILAKFSYPAEEVYTPDDWQAISAGGIDLRPIVNLTLSDIYAQRCTVTFRNDAGWEYQEVGFVPAFEITGRAIIGSQPKEIIRDVASPLIPYTVQSRVSGNPWIQTETQAQLLAELIADRMQYPRITYSVNAKAVPWLQLGDKVTLSASDVLTDTRDGHITGLSFSWQPDSAFTMRVDVVDDDGLFEYEDYFIIGTSKYGTGAGKGRFYI